MNLPDLKEMLKAGVHFGHQTSRWHPKMEKFIFSSRNGIHIFDLEKVSLELEKTLKHVKDLASQGKIVLFLGTKKQSQEIVKKAAEDCGMPYLTERWVGGLITNFSEVKKRIKNYKELKEQFKNKEIEKYTKKEQLSLKKQMEKMETYLSGVEDLKGLPDALYVASMHNEKTAVAEAKRAGLEIIGVCDTNVNPEKADYVIPANDDAVNSIRIISELISQAVNEGKAEFEKKQKDIPNLRGKQVKK